MKLGMISSELLTRWHRFFVRTSIGRSFVFTIFCLACASLLYLKQLVSLYAAPRHFGRMNGQLPPLNDSIHNLYDVFPQSNCIDDRTTTASKTTLEYLQNALLNRTRVLSAPRWLQRSNSTCKMSIYVRSRPVELAVRQRLRQTWLPRARMLAYRVFFVMGRNSNANVNCVIRRETQEHGDMIWLDIPDDYENLRYLDLCFLQYHINHFAEKEKLQPLMYTNTDAMIFPRNLDRLIESEQLLERATPSRIIGECYGCSGACTTLNGPAVKRRPGDRWFVPTSVYAHTHWPFYCVGYAQIFSAGAAEKILSSLFTTRYTALFQQLTIDDVLYSGVLRVDAAVALTDRSSVFVNDVDGRGRQLSTIGNTVAIHLNSHWQNYDRYWRRYLHEGK